MKKDYKKLEIIKDDFGLLCMKPEDPDEQKEARKKILKQIRVYKKKLMVAVLNSDKTECLELTRNWLDDEVICATTVRELDKFIEAYFADPDAFKDELPGDVYCIKGTFNITKGEGECPEGCRHGAWEIDGTNRICGAECPDCGGTLYKLKGGKVYCDGCGIAVEE